MTRYFREEIGAQNYKTFEDIFIAVKDGEVCIRIIQNLIGNKEARLEDIKTPIPEGLNKVKSL